MGCWPDVLGMDHTHHTLYGTLYRNGNTYNTHIQFYYRRIGRVIDLHCYLPYHYSCYV